MDSLNKINQNSSNLISEVLKTLGLILTSFHELAEVHLALLSPIFKEKLSHVNEADVDQLTSKLERLSNIFKGMYVCVLLSE